MSEHRTAAERRLLAGSPVDVARANVHALLAIADAITLAAEQLKPTPINQVFHANISPAAARKIGESLRPLAAHAEGDGQ